MFINRIRNSLFSQAIQKNLDEGKTSRSVNDKFETSGAVNRRWPQAVEDAMAQDFELRVNQDNRPMTEAELAEGLAWADVLCPTVTDSVSAELLGAPNVRHDCWQILVWALTISIWRQRKPLAYW